MNNWFNQEKEVSNSSNYCGRITETFDAVDFCNEPLDIIASFLHKLCGSFNASNALLKVSNTNIVFIIDDSVDKNS